MKKNPLFVAVSNQKGGVGKSTMLITLASLLNYSMGKNVAIVDCDSTQRSPVSYTHLTLPTICSV